MKAQGAAWERWAGRIDALTLRERVSVFLVVVAVSVFAFQHWVLDPLGDRRTALDRDLAAALERSRGLQAAFEALGRQFAGDPNGELRVRLERLEAELRGLEARLGRETVGLVDPRQMRRLVRDVLAAHENVELLELASLARQPLRREGRGAGGDKGAQGQARPVFYRHGLRLRVRGRYLDLARYLLALEALPWRVYWERLVLDADDAPRVVLEVQLGTLSRQPAWIGT